MMNDDASSKQHPFCKIRSYLYISGYASISVQKFEKLGITHVIDASNFPETDRSPAIKYFDIKINEADIRQHAADAAAFIQEGKESGGKVLVYCAAGISRSATICMMYLMMNENCSLRDAYNAVGKARSEICPNLGFWRQMIAFENEKFGNTSVKLLNKKENDGSEILNDCLIVYANKSFWHQAVDY